MPLHQAPIPSQALVEDTKKCWKWQKLREKQYPPPISFTQCYGSTFGNNNNDDKKDKDQLNKVEVSIHVDPDDTESAAMKKSVEVFEKGSAFKYCRFRENLEQLWVDLGIEGQPLKQYQMIQQLTAG